MSSTTGKGCAMCGGHEVVYVTSDHELLLCRHCVTRLAVLRERSDWTEARHLVVMRRGPRVPGQLWTRQVARVIEEQWGDEGESE